MPILTQWSLILLCFSMACAVGGGLYEHIVLSPPWSRSPPASFAVIQRGTGVPLQRFWILVHAAITVLMLLALFLAWSDITVRRLLLIALASYTIMHVWSGFYFIREMLAFQKIPPGFCPNCGPHGTGDSVDLLDMVSGTPSTSCLSCVPCWPSIGCRADADVGARFVLRRARSNLTNAHTAGGWL